MRTEKDRLSENAIANKRRYDSEYLKEHYKLFAVGLPKEEYEDLCKLIKKNKLSKVQFVRNAFEDLKKDV